MSPRSSQTLLISVLNHFRIRSASCSPFKTLMAISRAPTFEGATVVPMFSDIVIVANEKLGYENFAADLDLDGGRVHERWWLKS